MVQVVIRATSTISPVATTETVDGTISPCRLKFTTHAYQPSGLTCTVAGKLPSSTRPTGSSLPTLNFQRLPSGVPWAVVT